MMFSTFRNLLMILALLASLTHYGQDANTTLEMEIKTSGRYYWGQAISDTLEVTKNDARSELMSNIFSSPDKPASLTNNSDIFVKGIRYISFPRGKKIRVLAYILKTDVLNIQEPKKVKEMTVAEIHYTESGKIKTIKESGDVPADSLPSRPLTRDSIRESPVIMEPPVSHPESQQAPGLPPETPSNLTKGGVFLEKIRQIPTDKMTEYMNEEKYKGHLVYSRKPDSFENADQCYILVLDPVARKIIAFLDQGSRRRRDIMTGELIENANDHYQNMVLLWIQIF